MKFKVTIGFVAFILSAQAMPAGKKGPVCNPMQQQVSQQKPEKKQELKVTLWQSCKNKLAVLYDHRGKLGVIAGTILGVILMKRSRSQAGLQGSRFDMAEQEGSSSVLGTTLDKGVSQKLNAIHQNLDAAHTDIKKLLKKTKSRRIVRFSNPLRRQPSLSDTEVMHENEAEGSESRNTSSDSENDEGKAKLEQTRCYDPLPQVQGLTRLKTHQILPANEYDSKNSSHSPRASAEPQTMTIVEESVGGELRAELVTLQRGQTHANLGTGNKNKQKRRPNQRKNKTLQPLKQPDPLDRLAADNTVSQAGLQYFAAELEAETLSSSLSGDASNGSDAAILGGQSKHETNDSTHAWNQASANAGVNPLVVKASS